VTWSLSVLPATRFITNTLSYSDGVVTQSNTWVNSYTFLVASNSLPFNSMTNRGFDVRMVQIDVPTVADNSIIVAELMLSRPPGIVPDPELSSPPESRSWHTNVQTIDWNDNNGTPKYVPGLDGGPSGWGVGPYDNIATEIYAYLQLKAGAHRFFVRSDDAMLLRSGRSLEAADATIIATRDGTYYVPIDFIVEADGLYPIRSVWQEEGGFAEYHLSSVNPDNAAERIINDPTGDQNDPLLVKAFSPTVVSLYSSAVPAGPYTLDLTGVVNPSAQTVTVPTAGAPKFMKIGSIGPVRITKVAKSGSNAVISYILYWQPGF
jgi:hypothetical protein